MTTVRQEFISLREAARRLGWSAERVQRAVLVGRLDGRQEPAGRRAWLVSAVSVEAVAATQRPPLNPAIAGGAR